MAKRVKIIIKGIVQGIGYRPFVYDLAATHGIRGYVQNSNIGVIIDAASNPRDLSKFIHAIKTTHPKRALVTGIEIKAAGGRKFNDFKIRESKQESHRSVLISPDLSTCDDCLKEFNNKSDRRYKYPFITCTNCGPRFSIVFDTPYDRERTSMKNFEMCEECKKEYADPVSRRFHTETNSCPKCGPTMKLYKSGKVIKGNDPVGQAIKLLKAGEIVAVKGLGGFHLVCDAKNNKAVLALRSAKGRDRKPFALLCKDIAAVRENCTTEKEELNLLRSASRPIVLLRKKGKIAVSDIVAPGNKYLGVMLPYTPIHHLIMEKFDSIVATSANMSEEPICATREEVDERLSGVTRFILDHDREIRTRIDDSVVRIIAGKPAMIRRARGYVPAPIIIKGPAKDLLAVGAELKSAFALAKGRYVFASQHVGDLKGLEAFDHFMKTIDHFEKAFDVKPWAIVRDMHPDYLSSRYATGEAKLRKTRIIEVQHHHAHIASCMAENGLEGKVIGVAFDGMGMGLDGEAWGAEFLITDNSEFKRFAHLKDMPLPGGDKASREPWRMAVSYLYDVYGKDFLSRKRLPLLKHVNTDDIRTVVSMMEKKINSPLASSMGRMFDAVSAILGICHKNTYEGEAAAELEFAIGKPSSAAYKFDIIQGDGGMIIDARKTIIGILNDMNSSHLPSRISRLASKFHNTVARMILEICRNARKRTKLDRVCLSGGCFQNKYLTERTIELLKRAKFKVYWHSKVPANDGGISLGQAAIGAAHK